MGIQPNPPRPQLCGPSHPLQCKGRKAAMDANRVWFEDAGRAWWWVVNDLPIRVTHCLGCGMPLPLMGSTKDTEKWLRDMPQGDDPWTNPEE